MMTTNIITITRMMTRTNRGVSGVSGVSEVSVVRGVSGVSGVSGQSVSLSVCPSFCLSSLLCSVNYMAKALDPGPSSGSATRSTMSLPRKL